MFLHLSVSHSVHREKGSLYNVTSCLAAWPHVPSGGSLSLVPCSFQGVSGGSPRQRPPIDRDPFDRDPLDRDYPQTETHRQRDLPFSKEWALHILLECILVWQNLRVSIRPPWIRHWNQLVQVNLNWQIEFFLIFTI